jgi:signal transduction histidine kinase/CheY-like chemotaxis protein
VTEQILRSSGMEVRICRNLEELCNESQAGAGAAIVTEEVIVTDRSQRLRRMLAEQPPWSDLPLIVLTPGGLDPRTSFPGLEAIGHMTLMPRPIQIAILLTTLKAALRDRRRQYDLRDHLQERERTAQQLREADRRKDEFLAMLAHELRNPLAPIRTGLEVLALGAQAPEPGLVQVMQEQVTHLVRLVDDLLDVSRIMQGKIGLRRSPTSLQAIVGRAAEGMQRTLEERRQRLIVELPKDDITLYVDPIRLAQVLENLLNNASKYTDADGTIIIGAQQIDGDLELRVQDNGIGIEAELLPHLFDLFSQSQRSRERSQGGLGIGLALVQRLVEMHGGSISASSPGIGAGSEFVLRLPLGHACENESGTPSTAMAAHSRRILIIDDNVAAAQLLAMLLRRSGSHDLRIAHNGESGLAAAREFRPELTLLDLGMPGMDGYEVARRLRREQPNQEMLLAAVTGFGQAEDRRRTASAGFDVHLVKPLNLNDLQELLAHPRFAGADAREQGG